jgi:hypothetical protein
VVFRFEMKHSKQLEESRAVSQAAVKELEQLQVSRIFKDDILASLHCWIK